MTGAPWEALPDVACIVGDRFGHGGMSADEVIWVAIGGRRTAGDDVHHRLEVGPGLGLWVVVENGAGDSPIVFFEVIMMAARTVPHSLLRHCALGGSSVRDTCSLECG